MTTWFEYNRREPIMGDVLQFRPKTIEDELVIEHVDSTTIVERMEMTDEMKAAFEAAGYTIEG
jgi:hypothetical protein